MKKITLLLSLCLSAVFAFSQPYNTSKSVIVSITDSIPATINITAQDIGSSVNTGANSQSLITGTPTSNSTAKFSISGKTTINVMVSGTWTGTLQSEVSLDGGTTWAIRGIHQTGTVYTASTFTANFTGILNVTGMTNYRLRSTASFTGTAITKVITSINAASFYLANPNVKLIDATTPTQAASVSAGGALKVDNSANTQPISTISLPLPTGASTSANQSTEITALNQLHTDATAATPSGTNLIGKVGIDQTTPGTTNKVSIGTDGTVGINAALPAGTNVIGKTSIDQTTPGTTNLVSIGTNGTVAIGSALPAGTAIIGKITTDQTTHGTTDLVASDITKIGGVAFSTGQKNQTASIPVTLSNQNVLDSLITGQSAQSATINNILTATAGTNAVDANGYKMFSVQIISTATGGTYQFEGSNDNSNFASVPYFNIGSGTGTPIVAANPASAGLSIYIGPLSYRYFRLRIVTTLTGGTVQAFTVLKNIPFVPPITNQNTIVNGQNTHSLASTGSPVKTGGKVMPATPDLTLVGGDASDLGMTTDQQVVEKPYAPAEWDYTFNGSINNSTTASVFKNAAGASIRNYVTGLTIASDALTTATTLVIKDGAISTTSVSANVLTSGTHDYKIGDDVVFSNVASYTGISTATTYWILTVPSTTTYTLSTVPNGSTLTVTGSGTATSNRILFRTKISTAGISSDQLLFQTPLRGIQNGTLDIQTETASTVGVVYYNIQGYIGF